MKRQSRRIVLFSQVLLCIIKSIHLLFAQIIRFYPSTTPAKFFILNKIVAKILFPKFFFKLKNMLQEAKHIYKVFFKIKNRRQNHFQYINLIKIALKYKFFKKKIKTNSQNLKQIKQIEQQNSDKQKRPKQIGKQANKQTNNQINKEIKLRARKNQQKNKQMKIKTKKRKLKQTNKQINKIRQIKKKQINTN
ncbi:hypothetical protein ABPG74_015958 [Tetrahymena malaccensis]